MIREKSSHGEKQKIRSYLYFSFFFCNNHVAMDFLSGYSLTYARDTCYPRSDHWVVIKPRTLDSCNYCLWHLSMLAI